MMIRKLTAEEMAEATELGLCNLHIAVFGESTPEEMVTLSNRAPDTATPNWEGNGVFLWNGDAQAGHLSALPMDRHAYR
jgi:hypothetical protein